MLKRRPLLIVILTIITPVFAIGQVAPPPIPPPPPPGLTINMGVLYLFIGGIILGIYELKKQAKI